MLYGWREETKMVRKVVQHFHQVLCQHLGTPQGILWLLQTRSPCSSLYPSSPGSYMIVWCFPFKWDIRQEGAECSDSPFVRSRDAQCKPDKMGILLFLMAAYLAWYQKKKRAFLFAHSLYSSLACHRYPAVSVFSAVSFRESQIATFDTWTFCDRLDDFQL